jgi:hypothetical protein
MLLVETTWSTIEQLRAAVSQTARASLQEAAQDFAALFADGFSSVVLARVFVVVPFEALPAAEQQFAAAFVSHDARLGPRTPVLSLLGTSGREPGWNTRGASRGHLAIPLLDRQYVEQAPMIARLLADLEIDLKNLDDGRPIATRRMLGGRNGTFYVPDAQSARDEQGRAIIPAQDFVMQHEIRTVFGMGGAYLDGTLVLAIVFCSEALDRLVVDRFPSFISNFKMATAQLQGQGRIYAASASSRP